MDAAAGVDEKDVNPNPVSWAREFEGGIFYTAMGHTPENYSNHNFLNDLAGRLKRKKRDTPASVND